MSQAGVWLVCMGVRDPRGKCQCNWLLLVSGVNVTFSSEAAMLGKQTTLISGLCSLPLPPVLAGLVTHLCCHHRPQWLTAT